MSPLEERGRQLIAELSAFLRACEAGETAEAHLGAIVDIVRPKVFTAQVDGQGELTIPLSQLFQGGPLQSMVPPKMEYYDEGPANQVKGPWAALAEQKEGG